MASLDCLLNARLYALEGACGERAHARQAAAVVELLTYPHPHSCLPKFLGYICGGVHVCGIRFRFCEKRDIHMESVRAW